MKTTKQWLTEVKADPAKLTQWLERQYIGEALAADRIKTLANSQNGTRFSKVLDRIAADEFKHASWVAKLLVDRGIKIPTPTMEDTRYWEPILDNLHTFEEITGAGHHAETMRLLRITELANDTEIDADIREVFKQILPDEAFHAKAFAAMSTETAIESTRELHNMGLEVLGLEI
jgi:rubrerythrin